LSIADILAVLYFDEMSIDPRNPDWPERDRFVLSKGHACPAYYSALAARGYFSPEEVLSLRKIDGGMEGHPCIDIPGVDAVSGSLGMGLSQAIGMALGAKYLGKTYRTYVILGDGDMQEGNTWEAFMLAPHKKLDNLVAIYDSNKLQGDATVKQQLDMSDIGTKLRAFDWHVITIDGHDIGAIKASLKAESSMKNEPTFILTETVKGKGVSFMEGQLSWHGSVTMTNEQLSNSLNELEKE